MTEILFILTVIFVAYVVYVVVNEHKATLKPTVANAKPEAQKVLAEQPAPKAKPEAPKELVEQPAPKAIVENIKPANIKPATIKKTISPATTQKTVKKGLRDPKTGEVATSYSNYRFTKRWIKDALVAEGLVEKVYKNNELNTAIEAKLKDGIAKLEALDKYKP